MAVIRQGPRPEDHFSLISHTLARNPNITLRTKGVYLFLRSHSEGWSMSTERIAEALGVSRATIARAVNELIEHGYLIREQSQGEDGKFGSSDYTILAEPLFKKCTTEEAPCVKNPHTVKTVNGVLTQHKNTNSSKKNNPNKKNTTPNKFGAEFDVFWEAYPRKIGKGKARESFETAATKHGTESLIVSVRKFAEHCANAGTEKRYIPYPGTWLNQERWRDYENYAPKLSGRQKLEQMSQWMEEI